MTRKTSEGGFVLVEAIVALAVAALAAAGLMAALGSTGARSAEARVRTLALKEAELLLDETDSNEPARTLSSHGELQAPGLAWRRSVDEEDPALPGLQHVIVEVDWSSLRKKGTTRLEGYRITPH